MLAVGRAISSKAARCLTWTHRLASKLLLARWRAPNLPRLLLPDSRGSPAYTDFILTLNRLSHQRTFFQNQRYFCSAPTLSDKIKEISRNPERSKESDDSTENDDNPKPRSRAYIAFLLFCLLLPPAFGLKIWLPRWKTKLITIREFETDLLAKGLVDHIVVMNGTEAIVFLKDSPTQSDTAQSAGEAIKKAGESYRFAISSIDSFEREMRNVQAALGIRPEDAVNIKYKDPPMLSYLIFLGIGLATMAHLTFGMNGRLGGSGMRNAITSLAHKFEKPARSTVRFSDVAGLGEAKNEVQEFVSFLQQPEYHTRLGGRIPKGALLVGPPGTGKTLLAKAVAGEAGVPFIALAGSEFVEYIGGRGAARMRDLFERARKAQPCVLFIDEIDAIGRKRTGYPTGSEEERESTLNQLLVEMDGFTPNTNVVVLAATNRADVLDPALQRPGRFDRQITIGKPDLQARKEIFEVHLRPLRLARPVEAYAKRLAVMTPGATGADIEGLCNEAALIATRHDKDAVDMPEFEAAIERVLAGLEKRHKVLQPEDRRRVAYHEAGHVVTGWFLEHTTPLLKVSVIPRGVSSLGFSQYVPKEQYLETKEELLDTVCVQLGGRVAEAVIFNGCVSSGAQDDLQRVTKLAYSQVVEYGMNEALGPVAFARTSAGKPYSKAVAVQIDEQVRQYVASAYQRTEKLIREKKELLIQLAELLLQKEVVRGDEIEKVLGKRPFANDKHAFYRQYYEDTPMVVPEPPREPVHNKDPEVVV